MSKEAIDRDERKKASEFLRNIRDTLDVMGTDVKFHRKIMEKACNIIDCQAKEIKRLGPCKLCGGSGVISSPDDLGGDICTNSFCNCKKGMEMNTKYKDSKD